MTRGFLRIFGHCLVVGIPELGPEAQQVSTLADLAQLCLSGVFLLSFPSLLSGRATDPAGVWTQACIFHFWSTLVLQEQAILAAASSSKESTVNSTPCLGRV